MWHVLQQHLYGLYSLYGEVMGPRIARKHVGWYLKQEPDQRKLFNQLQNQLQQLEFLNHYFASTEEQAA